MNPFRRIQSRLSALFQKRKLDLEMDEELQFHLDARTQANINAGMAPAEARRAARKQFGWTESVKDQCRDQRGLRWLESLLQDLRLGVRQLAKSPGFTAVAVLTLALGIGSNTVVFSVAKAVLFRPLGFEGEDRLMWIRTFNLQAGSSQDGISWPEMQDIRESTQSFETLATYGSSGAIWEHSGSFEELPSLSVTPNLADALRIRPALGRMLLPSDVDQRVLLISHELWQGRFGGASNILGQVLRLEGKTHTIVGVLPAGLQFPLERAPSAGTGAGGRPGVQALWLPFKVEGNDSVSRGARMFHVVARLKPGVSMKAARNELAVLGERLSAEYPETNRYWRFELVSFRDQVLGRTRHAIPVLAGAVAAVLLICCVNLANLLLARGVTRQREVAVRLALGAGRGRLVQSLAMESLILALLGGALGIVFTACALQGVRVFASGHVPFVREATVDAGVLAFALGLSVLTSLTFGWLPALRQARVTAGEALRTGARMTAGLQIRRYQESFLAAQIAVVLMLLACAGLLLESFRRLTGQDLGYKPESVVALEIKSWGFPTNDEVCQMYRALQARLAALPGVEAVGTVSSAPLTGKWTFDERPQVVGQPVPEADRPSLAATFVAFDYFQAMSIPLVEGRYFRNSELKDNGYGQIVVVNEAAAALLFPGRSAVGGRFTVGSNPDRVLEVIGVVKDTRDVRLEEKPRPRFYWQYAFGGAQVIIRSKLPASVLMPQLRDAVLATDRRIRFDDVKPMTEIVATTVAERRFLVSMVLGYAVLALGIGAVGIFGVMAYQVAHRTNELGVRLALGASPGGLVRLILRQASRVVIAGLVIGLVLSFTASRLLASQLFGLSPHDPILLGAVSVLLMLVALAASWLPARRATHVDPVTALRCD